MPTSHRQSDEHLIDFVTVEQINTKRIDFETKRAGRPLVNAMRVRSIAGNYKDLRKVANELNELLAAPLAEVVIPDLAESLRRNPRSHLTIQRRGASLHVWMNPVGADGHILTISSQPDDESAPWGAVPDFENGEFRLAFLESQDELGEPVWYFFNTDGLESYQHTLEFESAWQTLSKAFARYKSLGELRPLSEIDTALPGL